MFRFSCRMKYGLKMCLEVGHNLNLMMVSKLIQDSYTQSGNLSHAQDMILSKV